MRHKKYHLLQLVIQIKIDSKGDPGRRRHLAPQLATVVRTYNYLVIQKCHANSQPPLRITHMKKKKKKIMYNITLLTWDIQINEIKGYETKHFFKNCRKFVASKYGILWIWNIFFHTMYSINKSDHMVTP